MGKLARSTLLRLCLALGMGAGIFAIFTHMPFLISTLLNRREDVSVFSARKSPDGSFVAESVMVGGGGVAVGDSGGRIVIRAKDGSERSVDLETTAPEVFLRWTDDEHLELWTDQHQLNLHGVTNLGTVSLVTRTYTFPRNASYLRPGSRKIDVPISDVATKFVESHEDDRRTCVLQLAARRASFDPASVQIKATITQLFREPHPRATINAWFELEGSRDEGPQSLLTSATIANLASYNRLPDGEGGTRIRGQFLGGSATLLLSSLTKPSITIDFSRDFFDQVLSYAIPLSGNAAADFNRCVGDSDPS